MCIRDRENAQATYYSTAQNYLLAERRSFTKQESINAIVLENEQVLQEYADRLTKYREK
jgi:hypothetical protein